MSDTRKRKARPPSTLCKLSLIPWRMESENERAGISVTLLKPGGCGTPYPEHVRNYMETPPRIPHRLIICGSSLMRSCSAARTGPVCFTAAPAALLLSPSVSWHLAWLTS